VGVNEEVWTVQGGERWEHKLRKGAGKGGGGGYTTPGALTANHDGITQTMATPLAVVLEACNILRFHKVRTRATQATMLRHWQYASPAV
jgi:hypothetical protein